MSRQLGIVSILVRNRFGLLAKVAGLFSRRGYNIVSISAGETEDPTITRITVVTEGDARQLLQISLQVEKLEDVISVRIVPREGVVERELCLIKLAPDAGNLGDLMQLVTEFAAKSTAVPDADGRGDNTGGRGGVIIEVSGNSATIDELVERAQPFHIVEMSRTGMTALELSPVPLG